MTPAETPPGQGPGQAARPAAPPGNPLDYLQEDHQREREVCDLLDALAEAETPDPDTAAQAAEFLRHALPLHLEDEEEDLFPLLKRRCQPDDEIDKAIARLREDHVHAGEDTPQIVDLLDALDRRAPTAAERDMLRRYATHARRHLGLENAIILPFARLRLTGDDLETLRLRMLQRRGLDRLTGDRDAQ